jgi:hypothetical protein
MNNLALHVKEITMAKLELDDVAWLDKLAPAGAHLAIIDDIRVNSTKAGDKVLATIILRLETGHLISEMVTVWADPEHYDRAAECARAKVLLQQLARATDILLPGDTDDLAAAYRGQRVEVEVVREPRRGVMTAQIHHIRKTQPLEAKAKPKPDAG